MVTLIQRFGSSLNLNVHLHLLVLDGVFAPAQGRQHFHTVAAPDTQTLQVLLARIMARTLNCLARNGLLIRDDEQPWLDLEARDALDSFSAASVQYRVALGADAGQRTRTLRLAAPASSVPLVKPLTVARDGFSLPLHLKTGQWPSKRMSEGRIEGLCRYVTRPALALERLRQNSTGQVVYELKTPYRDGTTHVVFEPWDFLAKLAA